MDDVVEKVAKEIAHADGEDFYEDARRFRVLARAAIGALKMTHEIGDDWRIVQAKRAWNAGLEAALAPVAPQP